jgi:hypothetical protein
VHDPEPRIAAYGERRDPGLCFNDGVEVVEDRIGRVGGLPGLARNERGASTECQPVVWYPGSIAPGELQFDGSPGLPVGDRSLGLDRAELLNGPGVVDLEPRTLDGRLRIRLGQPLGRASCRTSFS